MKAKFQPIYINKIDINIYIHIYQLLKYTQEQWFSGAHLSDVIVSMCIHFLEFIQRYFISAIHFLSNIN